ncbi:cardiac-enriched FHL2-interacting protein [Oryzias melastigma]|uniref:DUF4585 domain-containing protein n=1 Tax=Oryzias melastigma TaxID=30732 RepID=A0A3B3BUY3_ORYME|nr:cardiac-enriched FHL2-interacting protein [Oryzias melastigma]
MSCVEKRHRDHRVGSMLHHRFPNGFSDLFMDETDREVSSLTDRAFRSLCVGDDAVYSDDFLSGYSPFSCHKPLAGEPFRKKPQKHKHDKSDAKPWKEQQKKNMSSLLRALSAAEESCEGMLMRNGVTADSNGESWDKSALRSIQKELSEFSSSYHSSLTYKQNQNPSNKDVSLPSGKSSKTKNGKAAVKLRKLNIKNFFLHSEFSPFQTWTDFNRFPFSREDAVSNILSAEIPPKWYHLPFYKELTEEEPEEARTRPVAPPPPPKLLPKPAAPPPEKRCSSEGGEGSAAPWRRNRSRAKSAVPANPAAPTAQDTDPKAADESLLSFKKEVKAVEEVSSLASTPFSICQLMTPVIPSRQPTETSEVLQAVLSPSALDLPGRSQSEAKGTPEPPVRRETYKSLASSILFNLKDNRKRVKSRYSPPKFRTLELPEESPESPPSEKLFHLGSEGNPSGLNTPATQAVWSPILEDSNPDPTKPADNRPLPDDYLLANLLQSKWDENIGSPLRHRKANKSPTSRKQSYPSLNLYRKASPGSDDLKECLSSSAVPHANPPNDAQDRPADLPKTTPLSPRDLIPAKDHPTAVSPERADEKRPPKVPEKTKRALKDEEEKGSEDQKKKEGGGPTVSAMDVIRAAREAISVAKNKAWFAGGSDSEVLQEMEDRVSKEPSRSKKEDPEAEESNKKKETLVGKNNHSSKEPPPVPKRNFTKSDLQLPLDKHPTHEADKSSSPKETESVPKERKEGKHAFSARQNNYIKNQRCAEQVDDGAEEDGEGKPHVEAGVRVDERIIAGERPDGRHIENNLQALKELERARLGDGPLEGERQIQTIEEEAKAKNDLICRQLQSIKKEMLSMRGNTSSKREIFAKKEKEQSKQETGTRADGNASRTRLNDNYDRAKMALEEVISERERRRTEPKDQDVRSGFPNSSMEKTSVQRGKTADDGVREEVGSSRKPPEPKDDLQQILSQTEATETQRSGGTMAPPGIDRFAEQLNSKRKAAANQQTANDHVIERGENAKKLETPRVPPRNKKGHKRDESSAKEKGDVCPKETEAGKPDEQVKGRPPGPERSPEEPSGPHTNETSSTGPDGSMCLSPNVRSKDVKKMSLQVKTSPVKDGNLCISEAPEPSAAKQTSPSEPEPRNPTENPTAEEEQEKGLLESPRNFVSPVLQVNGVPLPQSPPDQASLSSKSSYFSVESTLLRSTETESNIYHSLETLTGELEEAEKAGGVVSEVECFSDQEVKEEVLKPPKEPGVQQNIREKSSQEEPDSTSSKTFSPTFSPTLGIPALFKVKDNSVRLKKATPPWTPKAKRPEKIQEVPVVTENPELRVEKEAIHSAEPEVVMSEETSSDQTWNLPPSSLQTQNPNKPPPEGFLAVPQEDDGFSRLTPSSEGVDSATTSTADTVNEVVMSNGAAAEHADAKAPSERSGSTCSGNDSQSGLPKPPAVLPKTEKAVLKAIRLTNRRMKKEEAQKSSKSSQSRSKAERHRRDKSDHNGVKPSKNDEKKHGEKTGDSRSGKEDRSKPTSTHPSQAQANQTSLAQTRDSAESRGRDRRSGAAPDRRGRSSGGNPPPSPERRDSSRDRVISSLPVYKAHVAERSASDRPFNRSQSIDRCLGGRAERRLSADAPASDRLDPRSERIEKSIMEELQQRGRARDKPARENPLRRSHSIDAYGVEAHHPASLSRQSSHSGQFSRQSSVEHTIVTQSFPISQRKILQDPDSGQYFFVDLPVQVKTKTFFDPETGSYVQLPVQPPEGAFPQPSPMEVLTPPMVVYHSFVPVPLSPMAQKATIHHVEPHEQRHMDRSRPPPCLEGRPYLEPAYGQHERVMVGEFLGTEGLDCPS